LCIRTNGDVPPIHWTCYSDHCEDIWKKSLLGLVRGILSIDKPKPVHPAVAEDYLMKFLGGKLSAGPRTIRSAPKPPSIRLRLNRQQVRSTLSPSQYFIERGFSREVLDRHDVGHSAKLNKTVVPFYDDGGNVCIGFLTRTELPTCVECRKAHLPGSPCRNAERRWDVLEGFAKGQHLYNHHNALVSDQKIILLVEGVGDVWKAEEAGYLAVGMLGNQLTGHQTRMLVALGKHILIIPDNDIDGNGKKPARRNEEELGRKKCIRWIGWVPPCWKDLGEMPVPEVTRMMEKYITEPYRQLPGNLT
jgi:hypothetical protein